MTIGYALAEGFSGTGNALPSSLETMAERIGYVIKRLGEDESVRVTERSWKTLQRYAAGADASMAAVAALSAAAEVPLDWLVYGRTPSSTLGQDLVTVVPDGEFALLPRYSVSASAGAGLVAAEELEVERIAFRLDWLRDIGLDPRQSGLVTAAGDSMYPTIPDGALMLVDRRQDQPIRSGYIYVIVLDGEVLVKRVSKNVDGTIDLISDNTLYPVKSIRQTDFDRLTIAGRVFWVGRKL